MEEPKKKFFSMPKISIGLGLVGTGVWGMLDSDTLKAFASDAWREEFIRMMVAFTFAMLVTRLVFRKDMVQVVTDIVTPIVDALNKIADKSEATDVKLTDINTKVVEHSERLTLIEQHLTPRQT